MADPVGALPLAPPAPFTGAALPAQPTLEFAQLPPPALLLAATLTGTVLGRNGDGALLLRTDFGTLALKTLLALPPGSQVDLRVLPGPPPALMLLHREEPVLPPAAASGGGTAFAAAQAKPGATPGTPPPAEEEPPTQLAFGTEIEATLLSPAANETGTPLPAGTHFVLRVAALPQGASAGASPTSFPGTIVASAPGNGGRTTVETPIGTLVLDRLLPQPTGTVLSFERIATLPPAAAAPPVEHATVLQATVVAARPGDPDQALPPGTRLVLRATPLSAPPAAPLATGVAKDGTFIGIVSDNRGAETIVETPIGVLALERRLALPPGTLLGLQRLAATPPEAPIEAPLAQRSTWPALEETLAALDRAAPALAARLRSDLAPISAKGLAGTLLFLLGALSSNTWPGAKVAALLDSAGQHALRLRLDGDLAEIRQLADPPSGDWRVFVLPWLEGGHVRPLRLYLRRKSRRDERPEEGTRFVLDIDMSTLGALQFDGLVRQKRFDLVLRSHRAISAEMRHDIGEVFHNAVSAAGFSGEIVFTTASRFAVAPLDALRAHIGVEA